jgi:hypothetical protein
MASPSPDSMTLQTAMMLDDFARYFAAMRRTTDRTLTLPYAGSFFATIPVALLSRFLGQHLAPVAQDADLIGK